MSETRSSREIAKQKIAQLIERRLIIWIAFLVIAILVLSFQVGVDFWPLWLVVYRLRITALLLLFTIGSLLLSPLLIEYSKDPRPLSGPGKSPYSKG